MSSPSDTRVAALERVRAESDRLGFVYAKTKRDPIIEALTQPAPAIGITGSLTTSGGGYRLTVRNSQTEMVTVYVVKNGHRIVGFSIPPRSSNNMDSGYVDAPMGLQPPFDLEVYTPDRKMLLGSRLISTYGDF